MKNTIKTLLVLIAFLGISQIGSSQFRLGAGITFQDIGTNEVGVQAKGIISASDMIDVAATFDYYFDDASPIAIEGDVHYTLIGEDGFTIAPLAGVRYTRIKVGNTTFDDTALQIGAFVTIPTERFRIYIEPKWVLQENFGFGISAGVLF